MADSKDNPNEFWRKQTVRDCGFLQLGSSAMGLTEEVEKKWPWPIAHTALPPPTHKGPRGATSPSSGVARERSGCPHATPSGGSRRLWGGREPPQICHPPRQRPRSATPATPTHHAICDSGDAHPPR
ncbi:hypothetical protein FH972_018856 [Carpinus fangiana]|uniref:Uncharacterized protein n=1 Tax=Carpinus fangiana TaxID=176857 RepID=A0A5N6RRE5_9ROSI|nr:hypothetical protein FH972_018856 [Carpinus fangiana]